jgi:hypothetical protein
MNVTVSALITMVLIPCIAPFLMDFLAAVLISVRNKIKGKPTWKVGTTFSDIILPNGNSLGHYLIVKVSYKHIILRRVGDLGVLRLTKRKALSCTMIERDRTILK